MNNNLKSSIQKYLLFIINKYLKIYAVIRKIVK